MAQRSIIIFLSTLFFLFGCGSLQKSNPSPPKEAVDFLNAQNSLDSNKPEEAEKNFTAFLKDFPFSVFRLKSLIGLSDSLVLQQKYELALQPLNEVIALTKTQKENRSLLALALFKSGALLRILNQDDLSLARLHDANTMKSELPHRIKHIELPFLLSMNFSRLGLLADSEIEAEKVVRGLAIESQNYSAKEKSEIYLSLGRPSDRALDENSFRSGVSELMVGQKLLLLSIEQQELATQKLSLDLLIGQYNRLYQVLKNQSSVQSSQADQMADLLLEALVRLENFMKIEKASVIYPNELFRFKDSLKKILLTDFAYRERK